MEKGNPERKKLKVNSVGKVEEKSRKDRQGTFPTINFNADDITEPDIKKGYAYSVANPILIPVIEAAKKGDIIEADVRKLTGEKEDGTGWTIHQVIQLYKDGQPIGGQKKVWGKSIETVKLELESKAKNTALMQAVELAKAVLIDKDEILAWANKFLNWLQTGNELGTMEIKPLKVESEIARAATPTISEDLFPEGTTQETEQEKALFQFELLGSAKTTVPTQEGVPQTTDELIAWLVVSKGWTGAKYARSYMVNKCKCTEEEIDTDPAVCYYKIKKAEEWDK